MRALERQFAMVDRLLPPARTSSDGKDLLAVASSKVLPPRVVWAVTFVCALGAATYLHETEGGGAGLFASATMAVVGALLVVLFRRALPAIILVCAAIAIIRTASYVKQQSTEVLLHAYDVVSLSSFSTLVHVAREHQPLALSFVAALAATATLAGLAFRIDSTRI